MDSEGTAATGRLTPPEQVAGAASRGHPRGHPHNLAAQDPGEEPYVVEIVMKILYVPSVTKK